MTEQSTRRVIAFGFGLMLLMLVIVTTIAVSNSLAMTERLDTVVNVRNVQSNQIRDLRVLARERSLALYHMALTRDPFEVDAMKTRMSLLASEFLKSREILDALPLPEDERAALNGVYARAFASTGAQREVMALMEQGLFDEGSELLFDEAMPLQSELIRAYDELVTLQRDRSSAAVEAAQRASRHSLALIIAGGAAIVLLGLLVSMYVTRKTVAAEVSLRRLNAELEDRVAARTRELSEANDNLKQTIETLQATQSHLVQSEKMASLGALVAGISHEVNTPIGVSLTAASHLQDEVRDLHASYANRSMKRSALEDFMVRTEESTGILVQNLRRAAQLIGSFKRVAVDQTSDDWQSIALRDYVDEILRSLAPSLKNTQVAVENACEPGIVLRTNPGAISQIISNLVLNALTHAFDGDGGQIRIGAHAHGRHVEVTFSDNGRGMEAETARRVFDPFFTTRRASGGSGLGLHIVFNLVTNTLRGDISVRSRPGAGTTFILSLPCEEEALSA